MASPFKAGRKLSAHHQLLLDIATEYADGGHSMFAPSGSAMWLYCSGSLIANLLEDDNGSFEAAEGTVAHEIGEEWLKTGVCPWHRVGEVVVIEEHDATYQITITRTMIHHVQEYVEWCQSLPGDHFVETKVYFTRLMPEAAPGHKFPKQGGTADHAACLPGKLVITDLKYGKGVMVFARDNSQALIYALGFFYQWDWLYDFQTIEVRIAQPRLGHFQTWEVSREYLLSFAEFVRDRAARAWSLDAPRHPSAKGCQWCKVKADCTAFAKVVYDLAYAEIGELENEVSGDEMSDMKERLRDRFKMHLAAHSRLSVGEMSKMLEYRKPVEAWFLAMERALERRANDGDQIPGRKLVESRSYRVFRDEKDAEGLLIDMGVKPEDLREVKFASPAQAEDLLINAGVPKRAVATIMRDLVYKPPGKAVLAPDSDPRPALNEKYESVWDDEEDEV